jgi:TRAP-type C4-dicarboxylate transport system permease small subunit
MTPVEESRPQGLLVRGFTACCEAMMRLAEILILFVMVIITGEVAARYIFNSPTLWVIDVSRYCLVYIAFLAAPVLLLKNLHINVDLVLTHVGARMRTLLSLASQILCSVAFLTLFVISLVTTWDHYARGIRVIDPIEIPKFIPLAIIPIGALALLGASVVRIASEWKALRARGPRR